MSEEEVFGASCPLPFTEYERITLAHGGGGRVMHRLIDGLFRRAFASEHLDEGHDGARLSIAAPIAVTTDAFTVRPLFFPGGDLGSLAVYGTVNDLAACGARAKHLTVCFVLEEGLALAELERIVASLARAARAEGVTVVAGDTKVVERGKGDGVFVAVTGIGTVAPGALISPRNVREGDAILVSGCVGDHGTAVMLARAELDPGLLTSDCGSVARPCLALIDAGLDVRCLRDATRGGLATVLCEIAASARVDAVVEESAIPVRAEVADACELLGLDPLYVACEGRFVAFVRDEHAQAALRILRAHDERAAVIGRARRGGGVVSLRTELGGERVLDLPSGEQLPRIC